MNSLAATPDIHGLGQLTLGAQSMVDSSHILVFCAISGQTRQEEPFLPWLIQRLTRRDDATFEFVNVVHFVGVTSAVAPDSAFDKIDPEVAAWSACVARADGFIVVPSYGNRDSVASLRKAITRLYQPWVHKPIATVSAAGFSSRDRTAEHLRQLFLERKMVSIRDPIGLSPLPGIVADTALKLLIDELLWWAHLLKGARARSIPFAMQA